MRGIFKSVEDKAKTALFELVDAHIVQSSSQVRKHQFDAASELKTGSARCASQSLVIAIGYELQAAARAREETLFGLITLDQVNAK